MTVTTEAEPAVEKPKRAQRTRRRRRVSLGAHGEPVVWLLGGSLIVSLVMIAGLLGIVFAQGQ